MVNGVAAIFSFNVLSGSHVVNGVAAIFSFNVLSGSHAVNGVAALHSDLIKKTLFKVREDFEK